MLISAIHDQFCIIELLADSPAVVSGYVSWRFPPSNRARLLTMLDLFLSSVISHAAFAAETTFSISLTRTNIGTRISMSWHASITNDYQND